MEFVRYSIWDFHVNIHNVSTRQITISNKMQTNPINFSICKFDRLVGVIIFFVRFRKAKYVSVPNFLKTKKTELLPILLRELQRLFEEVMKLFTYRTQFSIVIVGYADRMEKLVRNRMPFCLSRWDISFLTSAQPRVTCWTLYTTVVGNGF